MSGWDAEVEPAKWNPPDVGASDSAGGSGYPETKDESGGGNGEPQAWQGAGGNGHPSGDSTVISAPAAGGGGSGVGGFIQPLSGDGGRNGRRHTMAFEIARVERSGKTTPPNPHLAKRVWELSRPRYIETLDGTSDVKRRLHVPPGKESQGAVPYRVWGTSWAQMGDFGLDVGMYFVTFAQLMGAVLVYAALSIVAMVHFSSEEYSDKQAGVRFDLFGSAVCTSKLSVETFDMDSSMTVLERNDCPLDAKQGFADMAGVLLLFLLLFILGKAQDKAAEYTDTTIHSAQTYTVKVSNPDPLADDPDRWRRLFAQFGHVSYVTVVRGNGSLLRAMSKRRKAGKILEGSTANVTEVVEAYKAVDVKERPTSGPGGWWKALIQPLGFYRDTNYWKQQLWSAHDRVECEVMQGMHDQGLPVVKVFVTFESDLSQARCLSHMSRGILDAPEEQHMYTNPDGFKKALHVMPASPAAQVVYENLHVSGLQRVSAQILTFTLTAVILVLAYLLASKLDPVGVLPVALVITALDAALPSLVRAISSLERHHSDVTHDLSFMNKLTLARWTNLAGIPFFLNDRVGTLTEDNLELVATVLWLNVFVPPALRLLDIRGRWGRSVLARKEVVQSAMDAHFQGSRFQISERYTDTTKTIFACLVYAPVFPLAMWLCIAALTLSYWSDKYLFMRVWKTPHPPGNNGRVAKLARRHLALAVLAHCVLALYYYAGWPFDQICRFEGGWITCSQEGTGLVEAQAQDWMTGHQKTLVDVFSALNVAWLAILLVFYYLQSILRGVSLVVKGAPRKLRSRQRLPFGQLTSRYQHEVDSYVPQISSSHQPLPLLACDLDLLEPETIPWKVDGHKGDSFEDHCLSSARDLPRISRYQRARLFSLCVHYPAPAPFEGLANGRAPKTDMDWFRRPPPPPGIQESKLPDMNAGNGMADDQLLEGGLPMQDMTGLDNPDFVDQHPRSQAPLESNREPSIGQSGASPDDEEEPMMPGGAQSSLVSTTILHAGSAEGAEGSAGTNRPSSGGGGGGGGGDGYAPRALARPDDAGSGMRSMSLHSTMSGRSGRSARAQTPRVEQGDETSDICPGEGADEYVVRRQHAGRGGSLPPTVDDDGGGGNSALAPLPGILIRGRGHHRGGAGPAGGGGGGGGIGAVDDLHSEMDSRIMGAEDEEMSYYEGSHQHYDGEGGPDEDMNNLPTPVLAPPTTSAPAARAGGAAAASAAAAARARGAAGADGMAQGVIHTQGSDSSEGWVDQYTNSSLEGSREDLVGVSQVPSITSLQAEQWRKARLTPAV